MIECLNVTRRDLLLAAAGAACVHRSWSAAPSSMATLLAAWQTPEAHHIGLIDVNASGWRVQCSIDVPTRAHGLLTEPHGSVLAVARRPGDWLVRWNPRGGAAQWHWVEDDRRFNGHAVRSSDNATIWTTETDLDSARGLLGVRDVASLEKRAEWSTHGLDPHELLVLPVAVGGLPAGSLLVANGGVPTLPETGRAKRNLDRMNASLVALDARNGLLLGQWRLDDPMLSIRHLAWDAVSKTVGIALQSEHPDPAMRVQAPVLAVWSGGGLQTAMDQPVLQGYGGDVCALPQGGFVVSCPRADTLAHFDARSRWTQSLPHREACALAASQEHWWAGGADGVWCAPENTRSLALDEASGRRQIDNHWLVWSGA
jgi:uncharacterized protein